jgi:hypothetical protein
LETDVYNGSLSCPLELLVRPNFQVAIQIERSKKSNGSAPHLDTQLKQSDVQPKIHKMAFALQALAALRIGVGSASFLLPSLTTNVLFYHLPASSLLSVRLFGCRDLLLGVLLWTAKTPEARRRAVMAGAAVDALDVVACAWAYLGGEIDVMPALSFGGGAVSFLTLAALGWKGAALGKVGVVGKAM